MYSRGEQWSAWEWSCSELQLSIELSIRRSLRAARRAPTWSRSNVFKNASDMSVPGAFDPRGFNPRSYL